jgi:hypothetical protein
MAAPGCAAPRLVIKSLALPLLVALSVLTVTGPQRTTVQSRRC